MLVIQMLVILMRIRYLTTVIGVRAYFRKLINNQCQNDFCVPFINTSFRKYASIMQVILFLCKYHFHFASLHLNSTDTNVK
jgi:hypothetical protein